MKPRRNQRNLIMPIFFIVGLVIAVLLSAKKVEDRKKKTEAITAPAQEKVQVIESTQSRVPTSTIQ
ncbi:MAG: hypothetical protein H7328_03915 [Bdellovibrio sp.]|nr:hypothetical protein [Bdellovibrio sp.]